MTESLLDIGELDTLFHDLESRVSGADYSDTLQEVADEFRGIHQSYFDREAGPNGAPWPPWYFRAAWAPPDHKTLNVTGRLRESLFGGPDHIEDIASRSLVFGTSVEYAYQHQYGGEFEVNETLIGKRGELLHPGQMINLPQREFVGIDDREVDRVAERIADATVELLKE
jgi:phage gpG-like protein